MSNYASDELQYLRWFVRAVSKYMNMLWHDHVSKQEKATRGTRFINGGTGQSLHYISLEGWQAVFGDCSDEKTRSINRDGGFHDSAGRRPANLVSVVVRQVGDLPRI